MQEDIIETDQNVQITCTSM